MTWTAVISALAGFASETASRITSGSTLVPATATRIRFNCIEAGVYLASPGEIRGVLEVIRHVDDDRVRPEQQCRLQAGRGLAVQKPLPPVPGDELGYDDRDGTVIALVDRVDVLQQGPDERAVRRVDEVDGNVRRELLPAAPERGPALARRRDVHRLHGVRDRARERHRLHGRAVD